MKEKKLSKLEVMLNRVKSQEKLREKERSQEMDEVRRLLYDHLTAFCKILEQNKLYKDKIQIGELLEGQRYYLTKCGIRIEAWDEFLCDDEAKRKGTIVKFADKPEQLKPISLNGEDVRDILSRLKAFYPGYYKKYPRYYKKL